MSVVAQVIGRVFAPHIERNSHDNHIPPELVAVVYALGDDIDAFKVNRA